MKASKPQTPNVAQRFTSAALLLAAPAAHAHSMDFVVVFLLPWIVGWFLVHGLLVTVLLSAGKFRSKVWLALSFIASFLTGYAALVGIRIFTGNSINSFGEAVLVLIVVLVVLVLILLPFRQYRNLRSVVNPSTRSDGNVLDEEAGRQ